MKKTPAILAAVALLTAGGTLTGCSVMDEVLHHQRSACYATLAEMPSGEVDAPWIPADATGIELVRTTNAEADTASVLLRSGADLDIALCAPVPRLSAPAYGIEGAPDAYTIDDAFACSAWTVVATDDGWFGWTPNSPREAENSPS